MPEHCAAVIALSQRTSSGGSWLTMADDGWRRLTLHLARRSLVRQLEHCFENMVCFSFGVFDEAKKVEFL
jgi:hypothetical protein